MATFSKRNYKWCVQIQKSNHPNISKTFTHKKDAQQWANEIERKIDQGLILELSHPDYETLSQILDRYKNEITITKRGGHIEAYQLAKIMRDPLAEIKLSQSALRRRCSSAGCFTYIHFYHGIIRMFY